MCYVQKSIYYEKKNQGKGVWEQNMGKAGGNFQYGGQIAQGKGDVSNNQWKKIQNTYFKMN